jgi:SAM-dependent methyltransferase
MTMAEAFQPVAVRSPTENRWLFALRCMVDLQLLTIFRFLRPNIGAWRGRVLDVGAGEAPWRDLMPDAEYFGVDVETAGEFGMSHKPDITYYDGRVLPFSDGNFDHVLLVEVLEHIPDPTAFLTELKRVLRPGGSVVMTVPWSARLHHLPHDYARFTPYRLNDMLTSLGFGEVMVEERGNDIAVIANKLLVLTIRLLRPAQTRSVLWTWPLAAITAPFTLIFLLAAHGALMLGTGSKEDPLGYGVVAVKN